MPRVIHLLMTWKGRGGQSSGQKWRRHGPQARMPSKRPVNAGTMLTRQPQDCRESGRVRRVDPQNAPEGLLTRIRDLDQRPRRLVCREVDHDLFGGLEAQKRGRAASFCRHLCLSTSRKASGASALSFSQGWALTAACEAHTYSEVRWRGTEHRGLLPTRRPGPDQGWWGVPSLSARPAPVVLALQSTT